MIRGIGIDLVSIARIERAMERKPGFVERILTEAERGEALTVAYVAGRWAAKEAAKKAFPQISGWHQVEILRGPDGSPVLRVKGAPPGWVWWVSITHERDMAAAVVVSEQGRGG